MGGVIKINKKEKPYSLIYNEVLRDKNLSWQAKGLYAYLASNSDEWKIKKSGLESISTNGYDSMNRAFLELVNRGYIVEDGYDRKDGKFQGVNYIFNEVIPNSEKHNSVNSPNREKPDSVFPNPVFPELIINKVINNNINNQELTNKESLISNTEQSSVGFQQKDLFGNKPIELNNVKNLAKEKKQVHPCHSMFKNYWLNEFRVGDKFDGLKAKKINSIIDRIETYLKQNNADLSNESVFEFFKLILYNLSKLEPYYQTADLSIIDSKFITIVEKIKNISNGRTIKSNGRDQFAASQFLEQLKTKFNSNL